MTGSRKTTMQLRGTMRRLLARLRPEWPLLAAVAALGVVSTAFLVAGPKIFGDATNVLLDGLIGGHLPRGITKAQAIASLRAHGDGEIAAMISALNVTPGAGVDFAAIGRLLAVAAALFTLSAVLTWAQGYIMAGIALRAVYRLRQSVEEKLSRLPLRYFDRNPHGELLGRVTNDIDNLSTALQQGLSQILTSVLTIIGVMSMMFWISPLLAGVSLVIIPMTIVVTSVIGRRSKAHFIAQWQRTGQLNGLVEETYTGHDLVLAFGQQRRMTEDFGRRNEQLRQVGFRAQFLSGTLQPAAAFLSNLNYVVIAALGGFQVLAGVLTVGEVQAFITYSRQFAAPVTQIASQMNQLMSGLASAKRVFDFLDEPEETSVPAEVPALDARVRDGRMLAHEARSVRLEHVFFSYDPGTPLIEDFTLDVAPGHTVAIVGPTGAGKTTVVNLLMRFYEISGGRILLDGTDYGDLTREEVRSSFGMVLQDTWLFTGTIRDNIAYGKDGATDEEIAAAASAAYVDTFVRTLPDGYATVLDGDISGISSGQRQLLTIARAFLADPGILILDEATSNVDTRTEMLIQDAMSRLQEGRTSIVIAHRLSTIRHADTIIVMDAGRIVEHGCHEELLSRRGPYHDLYYSQWALPRASAAAGRALDMAERQAVHGTGCDGRDQRPSSSGAHGEPRDL
jgi:ABC-type multidrug transport system fused ATPase/permease subunit